MSAEGAAAFVKQLRDNDYLEEELLRAEAEIKILRETIDRVRPPEGLVIIKFPNNDHRLAFVNQDAQRTMNADGTVLLRSVLFDGDPVNYGTPDDLDRWAIRVLPIIEK